MHVTRMCILAQVFIRRALFCVLFCRVSLHAARKEQAALFADKRPVVFFYPPPKNNHTALLLLVRYPLLTALELGIAPEGYMDA